MFSFFSIMLKVFNLLRVVGPFFGPLPQTTCDPRTRPRSIPTGGLGGESVGDVFRVARRFFNSFSRCHNYSFHRSSFCLDCRSSMFNAAFQLKVLSFSILRDLSNSSFFRFSSFNFLPFFVIFPIIFQKCPLLMQF
jgi:hypothetical protein